MEPVRARLGYASTASTRLLDKWCDPAVNL
jgi:hypothetical protein